MNKIIFSFLIVSGLISSLSGGQEKSIRDRIQPVPVNSGFKMEGYWVWCGSVIKVGSDYHMFASRWPKGREFPVDYMKSSEIVRATSKSIIGPYKFQELIIGERDSIFWDSNMAHNPTIHKIGEEYVLFYIGTDFTTKRPGSKSPLRRVGYATATKIEGPWIRADKPIIDQESNNPAVLVDGHKIKLLFRDEALRVVLAEADIFKGPYKIVNDNVWPESKIEDFYLFKMDNIYHMICEDNVGAVTGHVRWGAHLYSENGINNWKRYKDTIAYDHDIKYTNDSILHCNRRERPQLLIENNRITSLITGVYTGKESWCQPVEINPPVTLARAGNTPVNLKSPSGTETDSTIVLIWDKPENYTDIAGYDIIKNGKYTGSSKITNFKVNNLKPETKYSFTIKSKNSAGKLSEPGNEVSITTKKRGKLFNILDYGAKGDSITLNTVAIQKAIDACTSGGTVLIPAGIFRSGALFLKSDMTLYIEKDGVLKGSTDIADYYPIIPTRFEGWKVESFSSLITAGKLDISGKINIKNLAIHGKGKISGGDSKLGKAMTAARGIRSRGRLICLMNCMNVDIQGLTIEKTPCWTIHYTFCQNVSIHDLKISSTASNGDGIDPDSSVDSYIFNCSFSTGDDCIAIKSGKNPEGNVVGIPTENVWITNCNFIRGHSLAIGSEMSGGVRNVIVRDCELGNLYYGLQIKGSKDRGGYVENIVVKDCDLQQVKIVSSINYNNDGAPAPDMPVFRNMKFINLNMKKADTKMPVIFLEGFDDPEHYTSNIILKNIILPENATVYLKNCTDISFENVIKSISNQKPAYNVTSSTNIRY